MSEVGHPRLESVPPTEYQRELTRFFPWLNGPTTEISESFCDAFYGRIEMDDGRIRAFRQSFTAVTGNFIG